MSKVAILSPGEMGTALAKLLQASGHEVFATVEGRNGSTIERATNASIRLLPTLQDVLSVVDIAISVTLPTAAVELSEQVVGCHPKPELIYVDANSVAPSTMQRVDAICKSNRIEVVDMTIRGLSSNLESTGLIYLSGPKSFVIRELFPTVDAMILGDATGSAKLQKMLMSGLSKGIAALVLELSMAAQHAGNLDAFLDGMARFYPDVDRAMQSVLPTYPRHARRRVHELAEVVNCLKECGVASDVVAGAKEKLHQISQMKWESGERLDYKQTIQKSAAANKPDCIS